MGVQVEDDPDNTLGVVFVALEFYDELSVVSVGEEFMVLASFWLMEWRRKKNLASSP